MRSIISRSAWSFTLATVRRQSGQIVSQVPSGFLRWGKLRTEDAVIAGTLSISRCLMRRGYTRSARSCVKSTLHSALFSHRLPRRRNGKPVDGAAEKCGEGEMRLFLAIRIAICPGCLLQETNANRIHGPRLCMSYVRRKTARAVQVEPWWSALSIPHRTL
jgi:hypothetical protein